MPLLSRMGRSAGPRAPPTPAPSPGVASGRRAPSRASTALTGCGLRSEGLQGRPARGYRAGGSAPQPRSAPRSRSALPAAAPRLPSAHPRPLQCPGSFSRRPAGCAGLCLGLVFLSFGERGRIQWESGPLGGGPGSLRGAGIDGWMDRCRAACKSPLGPPPGLAAQPPPPPRVGP